MKKAIIILSILTVLIMGLTVYLTKGYIDVLNTLNTISKTKSEDLDKQIDLENELELVKYQYDYDVDKLLNENTGCNAWQKLNETLKQIDK